MTEITDILREELQSLAAALHPHGVLLIIGGGYGLLLRQEYVADTGIRTVRAIPEARSTNDLDIFLSVEIVTDGDKMAALRDVLHESGYTPIVGAEHYQFQKEVSYRNAPRTVKVDLLAPPPRDPGLLDRLRIDVRRIRHRDVGKIHAHVAPEAFSVGEGVTTLVLTENPVIQVILPHPYSFLLLKLYAYRDRRSDPAKEHGLYHAFDLYRIIAMMTEEEYVAAQQLRDRFAGDEIVMEARRIVTEFFSHPDLPGALAILQHARMVGADIRDEDLGAFLEDLTTLFPC